MTTSDSTPAMEPIKRDSAEVSKERMQATDQPGRTRRLKRYLLQNFELAFVVVVLLGTVLMHWSAPHTVAYLNFYFLPVILGGFYLGQRKAVLGALVVCVLTAGAIFFQPGILRFDASESGVFIQVVTWAAFLILAAVVAGGLSDHSDNLEARLEAQSEALARADAALKDYAENLDFKIKERTVELERSKQSIENLKAKVEETLYSTMDSAVAKLIIGESLHNEKHNVSVLFSDLVGFTAYSEQNPPEIVIRDLNRYLGDMEPILLAYRGHIDRYMGDGIMCEFGAPLDYETHHILSVLAAVKMQEKLAKMKYPWEMRIGVSSGPAITGLIGNKRRSYTAIGDVVNLSARLHMACTPGKVMIDRYTHEVAGRFIEARKKRDLPTREILDAGAERRLDALHEKVAADPGNALNYFNVGQVYLEINEALEALQYFEKAMRLDPGEMSFKVAYAEAGMKIRENEKINIRGRRQRIEAYEVIGLRDPFADRNKISREFVEEYRYVLDKLTIPSDVTLPVEALDGSIGHSRMVAIFSYAMATCLGLPDTEKTDIMQAGFLADIGKEIIPHHLLNRAGGLSSRELDIVRTHPAEGAASLRKMGYDNPNLIRIVYHSHENFNGTGYPDGLREEDIPLGSRIVAVADAYDALISWRPYRDAWERHVALDEIARGADQGLYDPKVVAALVKITN